MVNDESMTQHLQIFLKVSSASACTIHRKKGRREGKFAVRKGRWKGEGQGVG